MTPGIEGVKKSPNDMNHWLGLSSYSTTKPLDADDMQETGMGDRAGNGAQNALHIELLPM